MMIRYIKTAWRNLSRRKLYTAINVGGLSLAMACAIVIIQFVRHEYGYDRFHPKADRIYRLARLDGAQDGREYGRVFGTSPQAGLLKSRLPEVEDSVRVYEGYKRSVKAGESELEGRLRLVDPSFDQIFSCIVRAGDLQAVLRDPGSVAITADFAKRLFGARDPMGAVIRWLDRFDLKVAAVLDDPPGPSYLTFDLLGSTSAIPSIGQRMEDGSYWTETYILLKDKTSVSGVEAKLMGILGETWPDSGSMGMKTLGYSLQPLTSLHLKSRAYDEPENTSDSAYSTILSILAGLLLFLASCNYVNLAAAQGLRRTKEVGVRKTLGAGRASIIAQYLAESLLCALAGLFLAIILAQQGLPLFNTLAGTRLVLAPLRDPGMILFLLGLALVVATTAGFYPAAVLSRFHPASIFRGVTERRAQRASFRKALLVFQFGISAILTVLIFVVVRQIDFMQDSARRLVPPGTIDIPVRALREKAPAFKSEVLALPGVEAASLTMHTPDQDFEYTQPVLPEGAAATDVKSMIVTWVDQDFFKAFPVPLIQGTGFPGPSWAGGSPAIINRTAARELGWTDPVGKRFRLPRLPNFADAAIIGVVEDFHMESMRKAIGPMILCFANFRDSYFQAAVRISPREMPKTIAAIEGAWKRLAPGRPFSYMFMDDKIARLYEQEARSGRVIGFAAGLAVVIACLGLFGLSAYVAEARTKEIGIRKALGASTSRIVIHLSKEFMRLVGLGILLSLPIGFLLSRRWLAGFAYRIDLGIGVFLPAVVLIILVAWLSLGSQTIKAARTDPAKSLRYE